VGEVFHRSDRDVLDVFGGLAGGLRRENRDEMTPGGPSADRDFHRRPRNEHETREAEQTLEHPEDHGGTLAKVADSNEFSAA
jgi:hypothetical protein